MDVSYVLTSREFCFFFSEFRMHAQTHTVNDADSEREDLASDLVSQAPRWSAPELLGSAAFRFVGLCRPSLTFAHRAFLPLYFVYSPKFSKLNR